MFRAVRTVFAYVLFKDTAAVLSQKFELVAITISLGNEGFDIPSLIDIYKSLNIQYHIEDTSISKVVFDVRKEKNPCSLCSNMKRGAYTILRKARVQ